MNINGQEIGSTINAEGKTMFNLANDTDLKLENVTVNGAKDYVVNATNENATVNLTNSSIKNTTGTGIISNVDVNVTADGKNVEFSGNTTAVNMQNADKTSKHSKQRLYNLERQNYRHNRLQCEYHRLRHG